MKLTELLKPLAADAESKLDLVLDAIRSAKKVQLIGHVRPDGDCIGSLLGLSHILAHFGVEHAFAAENPIYPGYRIIPGYERMEPAPRADYDADLTIYSDCADRQRAFAEWLPAHKCVVIDHHASNPGFGDLNWIEPRCAATGEMVYYLALRAGVPISPDMATALLLAIMTDTGCFRYSSVRAEHFLIGAELARAGAQIPLISKAAYESVSRKSVEIGSTVLADVHYLCDGRLAWAEARRDLIDRVGGVQFMPENLVSEIRSIDGVRVAILFIEPPGVGLRASFRGDGSIKVNDLAGEFGGGGHNNAAGLTIHRGDYETLRNSVIERGRISLEAALNGSGASAPASAT